MPIFHLHREKWEIISGPYFPVFGLNKGKYEPEVTPYLDTFHAVIRLKDEQTIFNCLYSLPI